MEVLRYPHESCNAFIILMSAAFGPVNAQLKTEYEYLPFQSSDRWMAQGKGPFHENHVKHHVSDGEINYSPHSQFMTEAPTNIFPDQVAIPVLGRSTKVLVPLGYFEGSGYAAHCPSGSYGTGTRHYLMSFTEGLWIITYAVAGNVSSQISGWYQTIITSATSIAPSMARFQKETRYLDRLQNVGLDMHHRLTYGQLKPLMPSFDVGFKGSGYGDIFYIDNKHWMTPFEIREYTSQVCSTLPMGEEYLPEKHFGELANDACKKLNANDVNMLEFLRDIRHPRKMIPKLRNLRHLKDIANGYLTIHYGLLPTISDLKRIVKAAQKAKHSTNRAGQTITSKSHLATKEIDNIKFSLEQHAKLCIENVDEGFRALINTVESVGIAPTLNNIWELIPYSFVVDWFVGVSDFLDRVDGIHRLLRYPIQYSTLSKKRLAHVTFKATAGTPVTGYIQLRRYHRWTTVRSPLPPLSLQESADPQSHWLEGSALIIQRAKT